MKWVTREGAKTDRVACPWLIKRFIDPEAEFLFVPKEQVLEVTRLRYVLTSSHKEDSPNHDHRKPEEKFEAIKVFAAYNGSDLLVVEGDIPRNADHQEHSQDSQPDRNALPPVHRKTLIPAEHHEQGKYS